MWFWLHSPTLVEPVKDIADIFGLLHIVRPMADAFSLEAVITFITPNENNQIIHNTSVQILMVNR